MALRIGSREISVRLDLAPRRTNLPEPKGQNGLKRRGEDNPPIDAGRRKIHG